MARERRTGIPPVPTRGELEKVLTANQLLTITQMEKYGWVLEFVRRPRFMEAVPLLRNISSLKWSAVEPDGTLDPIFCLRQKDFEESAKNCLEHKWG